MNHTRESLQALLLDLLSGLRQPDRQRLGELSSADWMALRDLAAMQRLLPMMYRQTKRLPPGVLPPEWKVCLQDEARRSAVRSLQFQSRLLSISSMLEAAGIPCVFLKGPYLCFFVYPEPGLRPLRDLDILVPADRVQEAYQILLNGGFRPSEHYRADLHAAAESSKHLPPLYSVPDGVPVEIHTRLFELCPGRIDLSETPAFWSRCIRKSIANTSITYPSPTDLLFHLIVHAVYDHQFSNGPLIITDVAYLLASEDINWQLFWALAEQWQAVRGCMLMLAVAERYWGCRCIDYGGWSAMCDEAHERAEMCAMLMLRDYASQKDVNLAGELQIQPGLARKLILLWRRVFPDRLTMAASYPVSKNSPKLIYWYAVKFWHVTVRRLPEYLSARRSRHLRLEARGLSEMAVWLQRD